MFKSNKEMLAELMPDENTVLILKKDLQLHHGILTKGTRVILRYGGYCGSWYDVISSNGCYIKSNTLYLNEMISEKGEYILSEDILKYSQRIQKFVREYFIIDVDKTKEYNDILEKKHINFGIILVTLLGVVGLITISILGWVDGTWCDSDIFSLLPENIMTGILFNLIFCAVWCILMFMVITFLAYERMSLGITPQEDDFLFCTPYYDDIMNTNTAYTYLQRLCKKHNLRFAGIHSFRHFTASLLISQGATVADTASYLGHSSPATTMNVYIHEFKDAQAASSKLIENALSNR